MLGDTCFHRTVKEAISSFNPAHQILCRPFFDDAMGKILQYCSCNSLEMFLSKKKKTQTFGMKIFTWHLVNICTNVAVVFTQSQCGGKKKEC